MRLSYSSLSAFGRCPRRFALEHDLLADYPRLAFAPSPSLWAGSALHGALEALGGGLSIDAALERGLAAAGGVEAAPTGAPSPSALLRALQAIEGAGLVALTRDGWILERDLSFGDFKGKPDAYLLTPETLTIRDTKTTLGDPLRADGFASQRALTPSELRFSPQWHLYAGLVLTGLPPDKRPSTVIFELLHVSLHKTAPPILVTAVAPLSTTRKTWQEYMERIKTVQVIFGSPPNTPRNLEDIPLASDFSACRAFKGCPLLKMGCPGAPLSKTPRIVE